MTAKTRPEPDAPLDWYLWMGALTGAALVLVIAPEFVQSAVKGKLDFSLIGQGIQQRAAQVQGALSGDGATVNDATIQAMYGNFDSLTAPGIIGIGLAEGTLDSSGKPTAIYDGHSDPGNGALNKGFGSWQASPVANAQEGDRKAFERIRTQCIPDATRDAQTHGIPLTAGLLAQICDQWIQAPLAGENAIANLKKCQEQGKAGDDAWLCMRVQSYYNPQTGQLEASGFRNDLDALTHDQRRRMNAVKQGMSQLPDTNAAVGTATPTPSPSATDPSAAIARLQVGRETCTGFFISESELMTAGHCFKASQTGTVTMRDGRTATAQFKITAGHDVAIAVVNGRFPYLPKAQPTDGAAIEVKGYRLGQWTEAIGAVSGRDSRGNLSFTLNPSVEPGFSGAPMLVNGGWAGVVVGRSPNVAIPIDQIAY